MNYKRYKTGILGILLITFTTVHAQQIAYYQGGELVVNGKSRTSTANPTGRQVFDASQLLYSDNVVNRPENISDQLEMLPEHLFHQGIQSPYDASVWVYTERDMIGTGYRLWQYNSASNTQELLFDNQTGPDTDFQFTPIAWSSDTDIIYIEAIGHFDTENVHEGVFSYNLKNNTAEKLNIPNHYVTTPQLSPDRKKFAYAASFESGNARDLIHGTAERILSFDISTNREKVVAEQRGVPHVFAGWVQENTNIQKLLVDPEQQGIQNKQGSATQTQKAAPSLKLPWSSGVEYPVSRHGTPSPTGPRGSNKRNSAYDGFTPHGYIALDFDTPNGVFDYILAAADGIVTFARNTDPGGYGKYLIITHSDGSQTLYAHMNYLSVREGDCVGQGNPLGDGGTTGNSTGDHLHFEKRIGNTKVYPVFSECGCTPRQSYLYGSGNRRTTGCNTASTCPPIRNFTTTISTGVYKSSGDIVASTNLADKANVTFDAKTRVLLTPGFLAHNGNQFTAKIAGCDAAQNFEVAQEVFLTDAPPTLASTTENILRLSPNPANHRVSISYSLKNQAKVNISVFNVAGLIMEELKDTEEDQGNYTVEYSTGRLPDGIYLIKLRIDDTYYVKKLIVNKS